MPSRKYRYSSTTALGKPGSGGSRPSMKPILGSDCGVPPGKVWMSHGADMAPREFLNGTDIALGNPRSRGRVHAKPTPGSDDGVPPAKVRTEKTCKNERVPPCDLANPGRASGNANESFREIVGRHFFYFYFWTPSPTPRHSRTGSILSVP